MNLPLNFSAQPSIRSKVYRFQIPLFVALFRAIGRLASQDDHFKASPVLWVSAVSLLGGRFRKLGVPYFGVLTIRILLLK